jgi:hypothetical protein
MLHDQHSIADLPGPPLLLQLLLQFEHLPILSRPAVTDAKAAACLQPAAFELS